MYCTVQHRTTPCRTVPCRTILFHTAMHHTVSKRVEAVYHATLGFASLPYNLDYIVDYAALQCCSIRRLRVLLAIILFVLQLRYAKMASHPVAYCVISYQHACIMCTCTWYVPHKLVFVMIYNAYLPPMLLRIVCAAHDSQSCIIKGI